MQNGKRNLAGAWQKFLANEKREAFSVLILAAWFFLGMLHAILSNADSAHALRTILMILKSS